MSGGAGLASRASYRSVTQDSHGGGYCWGTNDSAEMGIGVNDGADHPVPEPIAGDHSCLVP